MSLNQELIWLEPMSPKEIIEDVLVKKYKKDKFVVLYSGGQDSGCVDNFIATEFPEYYEGRLFTNTGIGSPVTRKFALEYSKQLGRKIEMTWARRSYYDIVMDVGFRGMGAHRIIMGYLKFQSWYYYLKPLTRIGDYCFISGVRKKESWIRDKIKFYTKKPVDINATLTFCKPFLYKNGSQLQEYVIKNDIKKSPAYEFFNKSGDCWCGCQNHSWELKMLEQHDPFIFNTIMWLEKQLQLYGSKEARKYPHWGLSVGAENSLDQKTFEDFESSEVNEDFCGESCEIE